MSCQIRDKSLWWHFDQIKTMYFFGIVSRPELS